MSNIVRITDNSGCIAPLYLYYGNGAVNGFTRIETGRETKRDFYFKFNRTSYFHGIFEEGIVFYFYAKKHGEREWDGSGYHIVESKKSLMDDKCQIVFKSLTRQEMRRSTGQQRLSEFE
ncbi:MAG: hypothetical protein ACFFER_07305 [Candidatus Thorarchaeota archaeon]